MSAQKPFGKSYLVKRQRFQKTNISRLILWVLGFMSFGYGTKEFEVTTERLGCYRPEEHIDNPKDYAGMLLTWENTSILLV